jgi:mono/diheme cytochrome c family protein
MKGLQRTVLLTAGLAAAAIAVPVAQEPVRQTPPLVLQSMAGSDNFELYCAACHGRSGRGDGPVAPALRSRPADLTTLARRNNGAFPRERVLSFVTGTGRPVAAHGSAEMPVWGPVFRALDPSDARVKQRIENLVAHVESLQQTSSAPGAVGAQLFRTYCASCHGATGVGNGPLAEQMRRTPPDLTKFTARNGGVFPSEKVYRIVDGRDVPSHGDRDMPVWGDAFRSSQGGLSAEAVKARIDAIVQYLSAIQERAAE